MGQILLLFIKNRMKLIKLYLRENDTSSPFLMNEKLKKDVVDYIFLFPNENDNGV